MSNSVKFNLTKPSHLLATGFASGLLKPAPGTWGTLFAVPLYWLVMQCDVNVWLYGLITLLMLLGGIYICEKTTQDIGVDDHPSIVWDEIVGFFITMILLAPTWLNIALGFILFRLFDIIKPWPIKAIDQKLKGGVGIMLDDVLAGIFACVGVHLCHLVLP